MYQLYRDKLDKRAHPLGAHVASPDDAVLQAQLSAYGVHVGGGTGFSEWKAPTDSYTGSADVGARDGDAPAPPASF
ncbi:hypothetical protein MRX96_030317 [Rhipicephalus microplus]